MKGRNLIILIISMILVGAGGFYAGRKYQQSKQPETFKEFTKQQQGQRQIFDQAGFRINGEIISADEKSITINLQDGSSRIILFSDKTVINKAAEATSQDLIIGEKITVSGQENTDGSITAQNIQINPIIRLPASRE